MQKHHTQSGPAPQRHATDHSPRTTHHAPRSAFTLIELLMVIVIIALLMSLLVPAIMGAVRTAREARVVTEIGGLSAAIADFKSKFGFEPPSRIILFEDGPAWDQTAGANEQLRLKTRAVLRRMFPQINFADLDGDNTPGADINGNGNATDPPIILYGSDCLVFFLGGVQVDAGSGNIRMAGFSKNPRSPFSRPSTGSNQSRVGPFFSEFNAGRLTDTNGNGMAELRDPLPGQLNPYVYLSSNDGRGYDPDDLGLLAVRPMRYPYLQSGVFEDANFNYVLDGGEDQNGNNTLDIPPPHKPDSYQIISPGYDGQYGTGGLYDSNEPDASLALRALQQHSEEERDNLTNFHQSRLAP